MLRRYWTPGRAASLRSRPRSRRKAFTVTSPSGHTPSRGERTSHRNLGPASAARVSARRMSSLLLITCALPDCGGSSPSARAATAAIDTARTSAAQPPARPAFGRRARSTRAVPRGSPASATDRGATTEKRPEKKVYRIRLQRLPIFDAECRANRSSPQHARGHTVPTSSGFLQQPPHLHPPCRAATPTAPGAGTRRESSSGAVAFVVEPGRGR